VQAEALLPEVRDQIVIDAMEALSDPAVRAEAIAAEESSVAPPGRCFERD